MSSHSARRSTRLGTDLDRPREIEKSFHDLLTAKNLFLDDRQILGQGSDRLLAQQARVPEDHAERVVDLVRHSGGQATHARQALALQEAVLLFLERRDHGVELAGQVAELVVTTNRDARVEVAGRQAFCARVQKRHWSRHLAAQIDGHTSGEKRRNHHEEHAPSHGAIAGRLRERLQLSDGLFKALGQKVGSLLNAAYHGQGACVLQVRVRRPPRQHRRHNVAAEDAVQFSRSRLDVVDPGAFIGPLRAAAQFLDQGENSRFGLGVEAEVTVVANDDGVGLVRVLVAHSTGQVQGQAHAVHSRARAGESAVDLRETQQGDHRGRDKKGDKGRKRQR
jgi:hypothetical protein